MSLDTDEKKTHFGYQEVDWQEKQSKVHEVFRSVASKYDLMNDLMSLGLHRLWKYYTINQVGLREGQCVLDVASGTGDLAKKFAQLIGPTGRVILTDINEAMLTLGRDRMIDAGFLGRFECVVADAEKLPFPNNYFDCITIAFGLRNVTQQIDALKSMYRVLKPGGKLFILEFSKPTSKLLQKIYDQYSFAIIPKLGELVTQDRASYQYLVESIRMHPDQETLKGLMRAAGFEDIEYVNMSGGIVALHIGYKY